MLIRSAAGIFWSISNVFCVLSILAAATPPVRAVNATALITSGLWGCSSIGRSAAVRLRWLCPR